MPIGWDGLDVGRTIDHTVQQALSIGTDTTTSLQPPITRFSKATGPVSTSIRTSTATKASRSTSRSFLPSTTAATSLNTIYTAASATSAAGQQPGLTQSVGFETGIGVAVGVIGLALLAFLGFYIFQMGYRRHKREVLLESGVGNAIISQASMDRQTEWLNQTTVAQELDVRGMTELEGQSSHPVVAGLVG